MEDIRLRDIIKEENAEEYAAAYIEKLGENQEIIIFGCSSTGKLIYEELKTRGINPLCFSDDVECKEIREFDGLPVLSMENTAKRYPDKENIVIILSVNHIDQFNEVKCNLQKHGFIHFADKDIFLYLHKRRNMRDNHITEIPNNKVKRDSVSIIFDKVEFNITAKCTLKCKDCAQILYLTDKLGHSDTELTLETMRRFSATVDYCALVEVFGGEPLLHPDLIDILRETSSHSNILEVVVDTNGTIMPKEELLDLMGKYRIAMRITDYGKVSSKKYELRDACMEHNVPCTIKHVSEWNIYGPAEKSQNQENQKKFASCVSANKCSSLIEGKWHVCARDAHMTRLGMLENNGMEYIDFMDQHMQISDIREKMYGLLNRKKPLSSCVYCDGSDKLSMGGIQREN